MKKLTKKQIRDLADELTALEGAMDDWSCMECDTSEPSKLSEDDLEEIQGLTAEVASAATTLAESLRELLR